MQTQRLKISEQEGNKIIAEFDGRYTTDSEQWVSTAKRLVHDYEYHSSWDWLMPIIKKLNGGRPHSAILWEDITKALIDCDIERTWAAVVAYIKWFYPKN